MPSEIIASSVDLADGTPISPTTANQTIKTWNINENKAEYIRMNVMLEIERTATSQAQTLNFEVLNGASVAKTINRKTYAQLEFDNVELSVLVKKHDRGVLVLRLGDAGAADAQTTITHKQSYLEFID